MVYPTLHNPQAFPHMFCTLQDIDNIKKQIEGTVGFEALNRQIQVQAHVQADPGLDPYMYILIRFSINARVPTYRL